jgi:hypothetical protein
VNPPISWPSLKTKESFERSFLVAADPARSVTFQSWLAKSTGVELQEKRKVDSKINRLVLMSKLIFQSILFYIMDDGIQILVKPHKHYSKNAL